MYAHVQARACQHNMRDCDIHVQSSFYLRAKIFVKVNDDKEEEGKKNEKRIAVATH